MWNNIFKLENADIFLQSTSVLDWSQKTQKEKGQMKNDE